ncbi:MAG: amidohydrolase [Halobacteriales archaeon]|nr:amidohydrolase [Halobacteriales archaeon]
MDILVENGHVYADGNTVKADVGVRDGRIAEVGDVDDADRVIDASGSLVLPGMVNAHTHASMTLLRGYADDLPLQTWLEDHIWRVEGHLTPDDIRVGAELAVVEMIRSGTTAFADMYFEMEEVAEAVDEAGLRAKLGYGIITVGKDEEEVRDELREGIDFAREYDGKADGRLRTMVTPHAPYTCDDDTLRKAAEEARDADVTLHTHLSETAQEVDDCVENEGKRPPEYLNSLGVFDGGDDDGDEEDADAYVAHAVHLNDSDIELLARRGVGVAHCPSANMKLASGTAPVTALLDAGVTVGIGTDGPASNNTLDMFKEARHAALVAKTRENDASVVSAHEALEAATRGGAELLGTGAGVIAEGRPADLAVVDLDAPHLTPKHDLVSHAVYAANGADVKTTIVDGEVLMEEGVVETIDEDAVIAEAEETARGLVERAEADEVVKE